MNSYHVQFYLHFIQANNKMTVFPISHSISVFQLLAKNYCNHTGTGGGQGESSTQTGGLCHRHVGI